MTADSLGATQCWASEVSPCGGGRSLEHFAPRGLWTQKYIVVNGGPWKASMELSIDDLGIKCLCRDHNQELTHLDQACIDLNNALRRLEELRTVRTKFTRAPIRRIAFIVNGPLIERWALKCVMNFAALHRRQHDKAWEMPRWLPHAIFGERPVPPELGLAGIYKVGDDMFGGDNLSFSFGHHPEDGTPGAAVISLRGATIRLFIAWGVPIPKINMMVDGEPYTGATNAVKPLREINFPFKLSLQFTQNANALVSREVEALRDEYPSPPRSR